ncbi:MAG: hypothetical protein ACFFD9_11195 [Candidatus Thorarchaeota archaeon]
MSEAVVTYKPLLPLYILLLFLLVAWSFVGIEVAQYAIVMAVTVPMEWVSSASIVLLSLAVPVWFMATWIKRRVSYAEPVWSFQVREISYREFEAMMKEYVREYSLIVSRIDWLPLSVAVLAFAISILLPLPVLSLFPLFALYIPYFFGGLSLVYGLALSVFLQRATKNEASEEFPLHPMNAIRIATQDLSSVTGVSWSGVRLSIGEAGGYYTIRSPLAAARVEEIEGSARIVIAFDRLGLPSSGWAVVTLQDGSEKMSRKVGLTTPIDTEQVLDLVRWGVMTYVEDRGPSEFLDELMEELGTKSYTPDSP